MIRKATIIAAVASLIVGTQVGVSQDIHGTIRGRISDAGSNEGLPSVNVKIKGTYYGAATDVEGNYVISNVNPGSYTLEVSIIGFKTVQRTDVRIQAGETLVIDQPMEETVLSLGEEIVVIGDKPLFNPELTASQRNVTAEDIHAAVVRNVQDVVAQQVGVVQTDNEVHIRGGRANENAYLLDGISVQDPLAGTGFGLQLSKDAVQEVEVITGGYNAEYGQATSGVVNVTLKEGGQKYEGGVGIKSDHLNFGGLNFQGFKTDVYEVSLSGPEPLTSSLLPALNLAVPGTITFFGNLTTGFSNGFTKHAPTSLYSSSFYGHRFAPRAENNWYGLLKATWRITPLMRLTYSYNHSVSINQNSQTLQTNLEYVEANPGYQYDFQNILDNALAYTHDNQFQSITWTHTLSPTTFYEVKYSHYFTNLRADANGKDYTEYQEPKDIVTFPIEYYNTISDTIGVIPGDGFYDLGNGFTWHDHYVIENTFKGDITHHLSDRNKLKAGFELTFQKMQNIDIYQPWIGTLGLNNDIYQVQPAFGDFYVQNNITFQGMILNVGLRFDYWFPGKYVDDAVKNPDVITIPDQIRQDYRDHTFSFFGRRWKGRVSPRLGISHPVSDNQMLFFSYGHFSKRPKPQFVYAKLSPATAQSTFQKFGNPDLNPETTVAYEIGLQTQFSNDDVLTVTAYYKDIFDYVSTRQARISTARLSTSNFVTYVNQDYARARGIEADYQKRVGKWFRGAFSASYSITTGKSSSPDQGLLVARGIQDETIKEDFVVWDRPFQVNLTGTFNVGPGEALFGFGNGILDNYSVYVRASYQSGKRYTPAILVGTLPNGRPDYVFDNQNLLGKIGKDWFWIDLNIEKSFDAFDLDITFSVQVKNVLNTKNAAIINPVTGDAYKRGDPTPSGWNDPLYPELQAPVSPYPFNPARYLAGRNLLAGVAVRF